MDWQGKSVSPALVVRSQGEMRPVLMPGRGLPVGAPLFSPLGRTTTPVECSLLAALLNTANVVVAILLVRFANGLLPTFLIVLPCHLRRVQFERPPALDPYFPTTTRRKEHGRY